MERIRLGDRVAFQDGRMARHRLAATARLHTDLYCLRPGQSQAAHVQKTPGLGLGLYICKALVEAHGGRIWAESRPGATTVRFTLPSPKSSRPTSDPAHA